MNRLRQGILDWCYVENLRVPHPTYCTGGCRFGGCWPVCRDCSGMTSQAYLHGADLHIGLDTGAVARDVSRGLATWVPLNLLVAGDLVMRKNGSIYNGGSDEHIGIFNNYATGWIWDWESAGSKQGHGFYERPHRAGNDFWDDGVRYYALDAGGVNPVYPTPEEREDMINRFLTEDGVNWYYWDGTNPPQLVTKTTAQLRLDLAIVHKADPAKGEQQVASVAKGTIAGLTNEWAQAQLRAKSMAPGL